MCSVSAALPEPESDLVAACVQLNSGDDVAANLQRTDTLIRQAADRGAQLVLLPENFALMSSSDDAKRRFAHQQLPTAISHLEQLAKRLGLWIIAGSLLTPDRESNRLRNSALLFSPQGECRVRYHKMHLFDATLAGRERYQESHLCRAGERPVQVAVQGWTIGLAICFDLRFPSLFQHYRSHGCHILTIPAAFTATTGRDHWQPLLQARAIETQCFVLAAAQTGPHPGGRATWGHTMIIDPWGRILTELPEGEGIVHATLHPGLLTEVRQAIPMEVPACTGIHNG